MTASAMQDWRYIAKRIFEVASATLTGMIRSAGPVLFMSMAILIAFILGAGSYSSWSLLVPIAFGGAALGFAQDRAEARAKSEWSERFLRLIESDHMIEVEITHKNAPLTTGDRQK